jgi:hypothetical protein
MIKMTKVTSLSLPKDQVDKIVNVFEQGLFLEWSLNDEGGLDYMQKRFIKQGKDGKISVPDRNVEPYVSTTPGIPDISIHHEPELKDGALALSKKGTIRFTHYEDSSQR